MYVCCYVKQMGPSLHETQRSADMKQLLRLGSFINNRRSFFSFDVGRSRTRLDYRVLLRLVPMHDL